MAKTTLQLQQLGTHIYAAMKGFSDERFTGQVQFHITMNQGGISRAGMLTSAALGYREGTSNPPLENLEQSPNPGPNYEVPGLNLIATMSKKE